MVRLRSRLEEGLEQSLKEAISGERELKYRHKKHHKEGSGLSDAL